jgi:ribosomal protein S18 acetylase RimI-like enzyme
VRLAPFDRSYAPLVLSWVRTPNELSLWASLLAPPTADIFDEWLADPDSHGRLLVDDVPIAYGELWVCEPEDEIELAHVLVSPDHRNQGVGRRLVQLLVHEATRYNLSSVWVRVVPGNQAAIRCYSGAGFQPVSVNEQAALNSVQPRTYIWLRRGL